MHFIVRVMMERVLASPVCRGKARNFSRFPIDDATGCLLFLVLRRNGVLSGHWLELMHHCYGDPGSNLPLNAWVKNGLESAWPEGDSSPFLRFELRERRACCMCQGGS